MRQSGNGFLCSWGGDGSRAPAVPWVIVPLVTCHQAAKMRAYPNIPSHNALRGIETSPNVRYHNTWMRFEFMFRQDLCCAGQ